MRGARFVLVGGRVAATWTVVRDRDGPATLAVTPLRALAAGERDAVADEADRLVAFLAGDAPAHRVEVA